MRPIAEIEADMFATIVRPEDPVSWSIHLEACTMEELNDRKQHYELLASSSQSHEGPLAIPAHIAEDPRLCSLERFTLSAFLWLETALEVDLHAGDHFDLVLKRLFGPLASEQEKREMVAMAFTALAQKGLLAPTPRGGFMVLA